MNLTPPRILSIEEPKTCDCFHLGGKFSPNFPTAFPTAPRLSIAQARATWRWHRRPRLRWATRRWSAEIDRWAIRGSRLRIGNLHWLMMVNNACIMMVFDYILIYWDYIGILGKLPHQTGQKASNVSNGSACGSSHAPSAQASDPSLAAWAPGAVGPGKGSAFHSRKSPPAQR